MLMPFQKIHIFWLSNWETEDTNCLDHNHIWRWKSHLQPQQQLAWRELKISRAISYNDQGMEGAEPAEGEPALRDQVYSQKWSMAASFLNLPLFQPRTNKRKSKLLPKLSTQHALLLDSLPTSSPGQQFPNQTSETFSQYRTFLIPLLP